MGNIIRIALLVCVFSMPVFCKEKQKSCANAIEALNKVGDLTAREELDQVKKAITASQGLCHSALELTKNGRLTEIIIRPRINMTDGRATIFGGFTHDTKIFLTTEYLTELRKYPRFDVVYPDDIAPNETSFALAHLFYYLNNPLKLSNFFAPQSYAVAARERKAQGFIHAWNTMIKIAEKENKGKLLSTRQYTQLAWNLRQRSIIFKAIELKENELTILDGGYIMPTPGNLSSLSEIFSKTPVLDLE